MKKRYLNLTALILAVVMLVCAVPFQSGAASADQLRRNISDLESKSKKIESQIKSLQGQVNSQAQLKNALAEKIAVVQKQIDLCNAEISKINRSIAANKAEIDEKNEEIAADKLKFQKRLRAITMSNTGNTVQILLGADSFSEFLRFSQLTSAVASRDKKLVEKLTNEIKAIEAKQEENNKLLEQQVDIRKTVQQKQNELRAESDRIQSVISGLNSDKAQLNQTNASIEKQIKEYNATLAAMTTTAGTSFVYDGGNFLWPCPGHYMISAGFMSNDSVHRGHHNGVDITGGSISGARIVAIADGIVTKSNNSCPHNYKKGGSCGCGGGFGNYVTINHGTLNGRTYVVTYGHMSHTAVGTGARVKKGQVIGYVGTTGWSTGYHLHLGVAVNGSWVNPMNYFKRVG